MLAMSEDEVGRKAGKDRGKAIDVVARRLVDVLSADDPRGCVEDIDLDERIAIDGRFNIRSIVDHVCRDSLVRRLIFSNAL